MDGDAIGDRSPVDENVTLVGGMRRKVLLAWQLSLPESSYRSPFRISPFNPRGPSSTEHRLVVRFSVSASQSTSGIINMRAEFILHTEIENVSLDLR